MPMTVANSTWWYMEKDQVEVVDLCNLYALCGMVYGKEETTSPFMIGCPLSDLDPTVGSSGRVHPVYH